MGREAKAFVEDWLGKPTKENPTEVQIEVPGGPEFDRSDRLLAYVYYKGESLTEVLLREGFGNVFLLEYRAPTIFTNIQPERAREFVLLDIDARARQAGFWGGYRPRFGLPWGGLTAGWATRCGPSMIAPPMKTKDVRPVYPPEARAAGIQGVVILNAIIAPTGKVVDVSVVRSIPQLDAAAATAVRQWEFSITRVRGIPATVSLTVTVQFIASQLDAAASTLLGASSFP